MDTPERLRNPDSESLATTPFRERALQEQKLKEELLLSATPGWRKRSPVKHVDTISRDHNEFREYLRDLSSVLASQGRNLTSYLAEEASTREENTDHEIKSSPTVPSPKKSSYSIAESVFSQLESNIQRPKIRKIDNVVIKDLVKPLIDGDRSFGQEMSPVPPLKSPSDMEQSLPMQEFDHEQESVGHEELEPFRQVSPEIGSSQSLESEESSIESDLETIEPLNIVRLKHFLNQFMNQNGIKLGQGSWRSLQDVSITLTERLAENFVEDNRVVLDRQNILNTLKKFEIVPWGATNDDIFEMCCKYFPLEELNELEMSLFL